MKPDEGLGLGLFLVQFIIANPANMALGGLSGALIEIRMRNSMEARRIGALGTASVLAWMLFWIATFTNSWSCRVAILVALTVPLIWTLCLAIISYTRWSPTTARRPDRRSS